MDKKIVLFITLGNRDLQVPSECSLPVDLLFRCFEKGSNDSGTNYIIKKNDQLFLDHSKEIFENYEKLKSSVEFPMVRQSIDLLPRKPDEIMIVTTNQSPLDKQDCHFVALFLENWLKDQGHTVKYNPIKFPPIDFEKLIAYYSELFYRYIPEYIVYFGNSGGTPDMRTASHFAGMFKGINFISIPARVEANTADASIKTYRKQEKVVLKHITQNMLSSFDFAGLLSLPLEEDSWDYAKYALARIGLDFESAEFYAKKLEDDELRMPNVSDLKVLEQEMLQSARIKFHQKSYADYLWRLFTIKDNIFIPFIEILLDGKIHYNPKDKHAEWNQLLSKKEGLVSYLESKKMKDNSPLRYQEPNKATYSAILDFFQQEKKWIKPEILVNIGKNLDNLVGLRNDIAHYYKGIGLKQIEEKLVKKTFEDGKPTADKFNDMLCDYTQVDKNSYGVYSTVRDKIINIL